MSPKELVQKLQQVAGDNLRSVYLYGSAAAGDHTGKRSDFNILVIVHRLRLSDLKAYSATSKAWVKEGNPPPLFFTLEQFQQSSDVFPIEILDMKDAHQVLFGEAILDSVQVSWENLRLELEYQLKAKLLQLRESFLLTGGKEKAVAELMVQSLSTFLVLFRAALRLFDPDVPKTKHAALEVLAGKLSFDPNVFFTVKQLKEGRKREKEIHAEALFERYLDTVERVVEAVDKHIRTGTVRRFEENENV